MSILEVFSQYNINLTHIISSPVSALDQSLGNSFSINFECRSEAQKSEALKVLKHSGVEIKNSRKVSSVWFPRSLEDLDNLDKKTLAASVELESDHPGFLDLEYRKRRDEIAKIAFSHNCSDLEVPRVQYTEREKETWRKIFDLLEPLHYKYACDEYLESKEYMKNHCGFTRDNIPQIQDINCYLIGKTGFRMIPIAGLLCARDFLSFLAFRIFASTQYIRHHSVPFYTPEPDIVHELLGHAPLFANQAFADFSQQLGLASLGASDEEIKKLATVYWFSVEFGLIQESRGRKIYGAGILSSVDEIKNSVDPNIETRFFDPLIASSVEYPITTLQPLYWWSNSFIEAKEMMKKYSQSIRKDFTVAYDPDLKQVRVLQEIEFK
jgi:phenylalanine-4-hydroxylase